MTYIKCRPLFSRIHDSYLEACQEKIQKQDSKFSEWESFDYM